MLRSTVLWMILLSLFPIKNKQLFIRQHLVEEYIENALMKKKNYLYFRYEDKINKKYIVQVTDKIKKRYIEEEQKPIRIMCGFNENVGTCRLEIVDVEKTEN